MLLRSLPLEMEDILADTFFLTDQFLFVITASGNRLQSDVFVKPCGSSMKLSAAPDVITASTGIIQCVALCSADERCTAVNHNTSYCEMFYAVSPAHCEGSGVLPAPGYTILVPAQVNMTKLFSGK